LIDFDPNPAIAKSKEGYNEEIVRRSFRSLLLAFVILLFGASPAMAACGAGEVDLLEYWAPETASSYNMLFCSSLPESPPGGQLVSGSQRMSPELWGAYKAQGAPGDGGFLITGGADESGQSLYFVYSFDADHIYFLEDQVWSGIKCSSGETAFYRAFSADTNTWGAPYDRCVTDGQTLSINERSESYIRQDYIVGFNEVKNSGSGSLLTPTHCSTPYEGTATTQKEISVYDSLSETDSGVQCLEGPTVVFDAVGGSGAGETMYLTKGYGLTAFIHQEAGIVDFHSAYHDPACPTQPELQCQEKREGKKPLFIFPKSEDTNEWRKYLSNSQVYCAPTQINWPSFEGQDPPLNPCQQAPNDEVDPLGQGAADGDATCTSTEYPAVDYSETYDLQNFSLPLFRDENGDISIESDLSRVNPNDTFFDAVKANRRPGYAPQFFLTSPQQQCLNAVRYIKYVNDLCTQYGPTSTECPAKEGIKVKGSRTVDWDIATGLLTSEVCSNFTEEVKNDSVAAQVVRGIETYTPKAYKMGFLVQHNVLFDRNNPLIGGQYLAKMIASWIKGEEPEPFTREKLVVVPIWYQSGIMTNQYSPDQIAAYPIDPETVNPDEVTADTNNFIGPFWETYGPVLPTHVQEKIVKEKAAIVKDTYGLMKDTFEGLFGTLQKTEVTFLGQTSIADVILSCDEGLCIPCADGSCDPDETEKLEELRQSFPDDFQPTDQFLKDLLKQIVIRINTGVQETKPYAPENWTPGPPGPTSSRSFEVCPIDQNNSRYGESEQSAGINYKGLQKLTDSEDPTVLEKAINKISTLFTAKIIWDRQPYESQFPKSRSYLILPDESIDIDIAEAYVTPMFLSPQMYDSIMKGENPIYPWKETNPDVDFMSAFLRTSEYDREHNTEKRGYAKYKKTTKNYGADCPPPTASTTASCTCSSVVTGGPYEEITDWIPYPQETENQSPKPENGCQEVQYTIESESLTNVIGGEVGENPETNIEVPGKTMALHEFLRRMAFTPHYLIQKYTGLEDFYGKGTALDISGKTKAKLEELSEYFQELITNLPKTYSDDVPANMCNVVFVDQASAEAYGDLMLELFSSQNFINYIQNGRNLAFLGDCGGTSCIDFVVDIATTTPLGDGNYYLNPLAVLSTVLMENGRMREGIEWHYSCNTTAFTSYNASASVDDISCVVETGSGNTVINPALIAMSSQMFAGRPDILSTCVAPGAARDVAANKQNTYIDGFGCYISVMQSQFRQGSNDKEAYESYGYGDPGMLFYQRLQEMATEYKNHAGSEYRQEVELGIRSASEEMLSNMANCL
jgi:hypothetical protein